MSPEPNPLKTSNCVLNENESDEIRTDCENNVATSQPNDSIIRKPLAINNISMTNIDGQKCKDALNNIVPMSSYRERRNVSPTSCVLNDSFPDPQSPSSSSSTSQTTSANDATFEPTIEMMVNDFDDEQTLNEEEALASLESQDPGEEIDTLKKEGEMPLEELLAKYRALPPLSPPMIYSEPLRKKSKKTSSHKTKQKHNKEVNPTQATGKQNDGNNASFVPIESPKCAKSNTENLDEEIGTRNRFMDDVKTCDFNENSFLESVQEQEIQSHNDFITPIDLPNKVRRSHLLDLYPEGTFDSVVVGNETNTGDSKDVFYGAEDDEEDEEIEEDDEDYKKKVMIGASYQASIPTGLSQYGDILPYENEDKLIWEPSQVSEREVEEYLIKIRDIKSNQQTEVDENAIEINSDVQSKENGRSEKNTDNLENNSLLANSEASTMEMVATTSEIENQAVVKDNEQALHLLVQCGYDFKEALRRKRLNALPLNDCMSLWSEEECHKFEEGIQKYGKDFLRIRQHQVRTRTMRELVQFYYLWKKSERRDHNFANADTVDHMDIYLNEDNEYGSNPSAVVTPLNSPVGSNINTTPVGKNLNTSQKNISIMTTTSSTATTLGVTSSTLEKSSSNSCLQQHLHQTQPHKRRAHSSNQTSLNQTINNLNGDNSSNTLANSSK